MDSKYVSRTLARCLSQGLAELIEQRPQDPIEFLALWILKYKQNQELQQQKSALERQLEEEQRRLHAEAVHQKLLQDEETRIRAAQTDAAQDPGDQTESETVKELTDPQNEAGAEDQDSGEAAAGEEQPSETLNTDQSQSQDTQKEKDEADVPSEENEPGPEKTGEDSDERQTETEDKESDRPETEDASDAAERQQEEEDGA